MGTIKPTDSIKFLAVNIDTNLKLKSHVLVILDYVYQ